MIGAASSEPETPWLEMVKLPPETSAPVSLPSRARRVRSSSLAPICSSVERTGVLHHRHHQALLAERRADADVDGRRNRDPVLFPAAVDRRRGGHRFGGRLDDVGGVAELDAAFRHRGLVRRDRGEIRFEQGRDVRSFGDRADHVLGDLQAHPVVGDVEGRAAGRSRARRRERRLLMQPRGRHPRESLGRCGPCRGFVMRQCHAAGTRGGPRARGGFLGSPAKAGAQSREALQHRLRQLALRARSGPRPSPGNRSVSIRPE